MSKKRDCDHAGAASKIERYISKAEIAYKGGEIRTGIRYAKAALKLCGCIMDKMSESEDSLPCGVGIKKLQIKYAGVAQKAIALKIFIARAYSKLGCYVKSNTIYRGLLRENVYMPPVVMGLLYNNFKTASAEKMKLNVGLVKTCLRL